MTLRGANALLLLGLLAGLLPQAGCATSRGRRPTPSAAAREAAAEWMRVENLGADPEDVLLVELAAAQALDVARRWGGLRRVVTLRVHANHQELEKATHQQDVPWMRGWARFEEVELEAPTAWGGDRAPYHVVELLSHELTHVVMYQRVADRETWTGVAIPLWFREGMASVTSEQGYRRMSGPDLGAWLRANPAHDPWLGHDSLGSRGQPVVYGAAHRAFERLLSRVSDAGVLQLLDLMRAGKAFDAAFAEAAGEPPEQFLASFRKELELARTVEPVVNPAFQHLSLLDVAPPVP